LTYYKHPNLRNLCLRLLLLGLGLVTAFVIFVSLVSINVGLTHTQQDGFWVPVVAGLLSITACLWFFISSWRSIANRMKDRDIIENI
jgi:cytochrome c biogenesis protein CcdA